MTRVEAESRLTKAAAACKKAGDTSVRRYCELKRTLDRRKEGVDPYDSQMIQTVAVDVALEEEGKEDSILTEEQRWRILGADPNRFGLAKS